MLSRKERLILLKSGHKGGDTQAGFYNSKEWLSGCGKEGKKREKEAEKERKVVERHKTACEGNHSSIPIFIECLLYVSKLF